MSNRLAGKVCIITGAGGSIGRALGADKHRLENLETETYILRGIYVAMH